MVNELIWIDWNYSCEGFLSGANAKSATVPALGHRRWSKGSSSEAGWGLWNGGMLSINGGYSKILIYEMNFISYVLICFINFNRCIFPRIHVHTMYLHPPSTQRNVCILHFTKQISKMEVWKRRNWMAARGTCFLKQQNWNVSNQNQECESTAPNLGISPRHAHIMFV